MLDKLPVVLLNFPVLQPNLFSVNGHAPVQRTVNEGDATYTSPPLSNPLLRLGVRMYSKLIAPSLERPGVEFGGGFNLEPVSALEILARVGCPPPAVLGEGRLVPPRFSPCLCLAPGGR